MLLNKTHQKHTKTCSEEYNFTWRIHGFPKFQSCADLLANQQIFFNMGSKINIPTRWKCYLWKSKSGQSTIIGLCLLDCPSDASKIMVNFQVRSAKNNGYEWFRSAFTENMKVDGQMRGQYLPDEIANNRYTMLDHCQENMGDLVLHVSVTLFNLELIERQSMFESHLMDWQENQQKKILSKLVKYHKILRKNNTNTILISSDDQEFPVMRDMLCAQSPVFAGMFQSGMQEENGIVKVYDVSGEPLRLLLEYIHTGNLNKNWAKPGIIEEFVYATHKYMLKELLEFENKMLPFYCTRENVDGLLDLAKLLGLKRAEKDLGEYKTKGNLWREITPFPEMIETAMDNAEVLNNAERLNNVEPLGNFWYVGDKLYFYIFMLCCALLIAIYDHLQTAQCIKQK